MYVVCFWHADRASALFNVINKYYVFTTYFYAWHDIIKSAMFLTITAVLITYILHELISNNDILCSATRTNIFHRPYKIVNNVFCD